MGQMTTVQGAIVDSWLEPVGLSRERRRLILQIAPQGHPRDLWIVMVELALVPDRGWLEDLSENLCHGSPVAAQGHVTPPGWLSATSLELCR